MTVEKSAIEWRRHLHQYPEFGTEEFKTAEFVANKLEEFGLEVHRGIGGTGVVGILRQGISERSIGLRADMDALRIKEENTFCHASKHEGAMHACGHDGHTAMLLGAACELAQSQNFDGIVYFIFQPDEERGTGAKAMIADGLFTRWNMDAIYAMHNLPGIPAGKFVTRPSSVMASESSFEIRINATGGHAALPHMGTDPIVVGAQVVTALQTIVSRNLSAINETAVISVTNFETNGTVNVIPSQVTITGDTRSFTDEALHKIEKGIERVVAGQCMSAGVDYQYHFNNSFLSTINTPEETQHAIAAAEAVVGSDNVIGNCEPFTISEDFSFMLREVKGCYILVGNGVGECGGTALHNPHYDFNDDILGTGMRYWQTLVEQQLAK
ncbi:TPA: M20 aminoacylase family protein [Vibrio parahaemolyticus]|uniref:M20 aminoacylase family protein n=1 Tax=Vibrio parahaemolyticus TaxID=670 RepID=UPI0003FA067E|nr:M20 aminoacylase family protein [Vibrio parahaemolyticus]MBE3897520.1 amidohydrolase [Vibrio parahaemolyticus]MBE4308837.1 amidohydrolase [Vibrio parahaemolyticus]MEA5368618.1 M20 aminoacylase family protein [Vibrio parahaemolyticus]TBT84735.1 amidohydrolase [Vibrio parahaemolyticus]TOG38145.1 amidohydrolase [Vibrio parahaemolyticus]